MGEDWVQVGAEAEKEVVAAVDPENPVAAEIADPENPVASEIVGLEVVAR